ncbi:MAG: hypothetical protein GOV02_02780 [Candidatus Aenigmarchaeota archaeon]|nr:hypothetical protein [Candidatus Aenigmarchaeota archaeon]
MLSKEQADEKVSQKWLRVNMVFEVIGVKEEVAQVALKDLMNKLDNDKRVGLYHTEYSDIAKIENPTKQIKEGFSQICETKLAVKSLENLVDLVMEYGPAGIEVTEPARIEISVGEAQTIANSVSQMIHRFAAAGIGGLLFIKEKIK